MSRAANRFFRSSSCFFPRCLERAGASNMRRLILLLAVGWLPPSVPPARACLALASRVTPHRGCGSSHAPGNLSEVHWSMGCLPSSAVLVLRHDQHLMG